MKTCSTCKVEKPYTAFSRRSRSTDGYFASCKACESARQKRWREKNREHVLGAKKRWYQENREKELARSKRWREENADYAHKKAKQWREENADRARENHARWSGNNREHLAAYKHARRVAQRDALDAYKRTKGCVDCGTTDGRLDFDHRPDEPKSFTIGDGGTRSASAIWAEVAKCDVRCASCHITRHNLERGATSVP